MDATAEVHLLAEVWKAASYSAFIVNWVTAEVASPTFAHLYDGLSERLLNKIRENPRQDAGNFTDSEVREMETALRKARHNLFGFYKVGPSMSFRRVRVPLLSLKKFDVMKPFVGKWPNFGAWAMYEQLTGKLGLLKSVKNMMSLMKLGVNPCGCPVAIWSPEGPPVLIEGYKRSLLAVHCGEPMVDVMMCLPEGV